VTQEQLALQDPMVLLALRAILDHLDQVVNVVNQVRQVPLFQGHQEFADQLDLLDSLEMSDLRDMAVHQVILCPVNRSDMRSLEFTVKHILIKLFHTYDNVIIDSCMTSFGLGTDSEPLNKSKNRFLLKLNLQDNLLCTVCQ